MKKKTTKLRHRDVSDAVDLVSGKWRGAILASLCEEGPKRFSQLKTALSPVTSKVLTKELRYLEMNLMVKSEKSTQARNSVLYAVTEHGLSITPVIHTIQEWSLMHRNLVLHKWREESDDKK